MKFLFQVKKLCIPFFKPPVDSFQYILTLLEIKGLRKNF
jgi:hypothetical protein